MFLHAVTPAFSIRRAASADALALSLVAQGAFLESFAGQVDGADIIAHVAGKSSQASFAAWLSEPQGALWLAEMAPGRAPIGYAGLTTPDALSVPIEPGDIELRRIYLFHRFHGGGAARALLDAALAHARDAGARRMLIGVNAENARAIAFYRKNGFTQIGTRQFLVGANRYNDVVLARILV
jgi:diamine N-acetyltransferase